MPSSIVTRAIASTRYTAISLFGAALCLISGELLFTLKLPVAGLAITIAGVLLCALGALLAWHGFEDRETVALSRSKWQPARRLELMCAVELGVLALALRVLWLDTLPLRIDGDAAAFALHATDFLQPNPPPLIGTGWQSHTNLYLWLNSFGVRLFGHTALGIRSFSALGGTLGVLAIFALGRSLWSFRVGLLAALATAVLPFDLVFSRAGTEVIHMTWLLPLAVLSISRGWQRESATWLLIGGAVAGLSQYFYPGARLIPILCAVQIALLTWFGSEDPRPWRRGAWGLAWVVVGFVLVYGPMIPHFIEHPDAYTARMELVSITSTGWLADQLAHHPWWQVLIDQLRRAYLPFVFPVGGPQVWYVWSQYLSPVNGALLILGLIGIWHGAGTPRWLRWFLAVYLGVGMLLGGVLTIDTPMPSRYVIFIPAVTLAIGFALDRLIEQALHWSRLPWRDVTLGLIIGSLYAYGGAGIASYLEHDTDAIWATDPTAQTASYAARVLGARPDQSYDLFFLAAREMYYGANPALPFLLDRSLYAEIDIKEPLTCGLLNETLRGRATVIVAPPERIDELQPIARRVPNAHLQILNNPRGKPVVGILDLPPVATNSTICTDD